MDFVSVFALYLALTCTDKMNYDVLKYMQKALFGLKHFATIILSLLLIIKKSIEREKLECQHIENNRDNKA